MLGSVTSRSAVSPQMEPKCGFCFRKLSPEWWERSPLANTGRYGEKPLLNGANDVGFACQIW